MAYYPISLQAGVPYYFNTPGRVLLVDQVGVAGAIDITPVFNGQEQTKIPARKVGFKYVNDFSGLILLSAVATNCALFASFNEVNLGFTDGSSVAVPGGVAITNTAGNPVNVLFSGTVAPVIGTINNTPAQAIPVTLHGSDDLTPIPIQKAALATLIDNVAVVVGVVATALVSDATLKRLVLRNAHATATIAIGGAGVTLANGARVLLPGDIWTEEDAAGAAWFAISDTAATSVQVGGAK